MKRSFQMRNTIRELSSDELKQVNGGIIPVVAAIGSFFTHHAVRSVGQYYLGRALTSYAVYSAADAVSDVSDK